MGETGKCNTCGGTGQLHRQDCGSHGLTVGCSECGGSGGWGKCSHCDNAIRIKHGDLCGSCIADEIDFFDDNANDCANCGGEGFTYGCGWDWQCDTYDQGEGTCLCTRRCEWCQPLTPAEVRATPKEPPHV